ncbi:MAG TPA: NADH-quinone oxidoreductase subunit K [Sandaracinaceae bacterium LLY-WYZ-13_1]|nr:NADH-quinone oxidoreductase subunit K [Sandaracinaceae bacterium LLY-WYZ-13_1]
MLSALVGVLFAASIYLMLRHSTVKILIGLSLLGHAANLFVFSAAGPHRRDPPVIPSGEEAVSHPVADPLPQALILTAIVITFAVVVFAVVLVHRTHQTTGVRDVDSLAKRE